MDTKCWSGALACGFKRPRRRGPQSRGRGRRPRAEQPGETHVSSAQRSAGGRMGAGHRAGGAPLQRRAPHGSGVATAAAGRRLRPSRMRFAPSLVALQTVNKLMESLLEVPSPDIHGKLSPLRGWKGARRGRRRLAPCGRARLPSWTFRMICDRTYNPEFFQS